MEYKTLQDIPRPIRKYYNENTDGSVTRKTIPENKTIKHLEKVASLGKPVRVLELFADAVLAYLPWSYYFEYVEWLSVCAEVEDYNSNLPLLGYSDDETPIYAAPKDLPLEPVESVYPTKDELLAPYLLAVLKKEREVLVENLTVEVDGLVFDADEKSQDRMNRAITSLSGTTETIVWVLADNTPAEVNKTTLKKALRAAGQAQTDVWLTPYTS